MVQELPKGFNDPVAKARIARLHAEVQRLAHSSPPVVGREARIRELKSAISVLVKCQLGFTSAKWHLSIYGRMPLGFLVVGIVLLFLKMVISGIESLPSAAGMVRAGVYFLIALVSVGAWDILKTRYRLRKAEALADLLPEEHN